MLCVLMPASSKKQKIPKPPMRLRDEKIRGTTLFISLKEKSLTTSSKVTPCNGGIRVSLLAEALTRPTREEDCPDHPHRLAPAADSLKHPKRARFPSLSLVETVMNTYIKTLFSRFVKTEYCENYQFCVKCAKRTKNSAYLWTF